MKTYLYIPLLAILLFYSCSNEKPYVCNCDTSDLAFNTRIINQFKKHLVSNDWRKKEYQMDHLWKANHETYRILMIYSLTYYSHVYTIENGNNGPQIIVQQFVAPHVDKVHNKLDKQLIVKLSDKQWREIKRSFEENCFWSQKIDTVMKQTLDGGEWYVEGFDPTKRNCAKTDYHIDICSFGEDNKLGHIVRKVKSYVDQKKLKNVLE